RRCANHFYSVLEHLGLVRFYRVTTNRIERRSKRDGLAINSEHRLVTGVSRNFFYVLVVIPKRHGKAIHFDPEPLFEQLLGADYFVLHPLLVLRASEFRPSSLPASAGEHNAMPFAQVLVSRGVCLNIDAVIPHIRELFPRNGFAAT